MFRPMLARCQDVVPKNLWCTDRRKAFRNPDLRRPHQPLQRTWHRRERPLRLMLMGKGSVMPQTLVLQQRSLKRTI